MARPSKYETHVAPRFEEIQDWVRNGATDEEVAKRLGIAYSTFRGYKDEFSAFSAVLKKGKDYVDAQVENALLERAIGWKVLLKRPYKVKRTVFENGRRVEEKEEIVYADYEEYVIPDTTAQIFWMKNRRPDKWREKVEKLDQTDAEKYPAITIPADLMCSKYIDLNRRITSGEVREAIIKGGRGGWKSTYPGLKIPELIMANPQMHCLAVRNVKDTLKDSVYSQIKWGIEMLGVADRFKCTVSPLAITYLPTGQQIYFRGADDPLKIKSIKPPFGYIGILWLEEFDQYAGESTIRNIKQSALRGTDKNGESRAIIFETYNPPRTTQAWANQYTADIEARQNNKETRKVGTEVLHTSYKDLPPEWLGEEFLFEAEELERNNPKAYANEYLGEVTGTGGNVFENLEIRTITDEEIDTFGQIKQGLDWGYFPDPTAFVRVYYNPSNMTVYIFDERKYVKTGNEELAVRLNLFKDTQTIADNAEEKSIAFFKEQGYKMRACVKGAGSVDYGMKWLASRAKIVIDRARCPESAKEFEMSEYLKDKDGNYISGYPDENNHFQDAVRYALNDEIMRAKHYMTGGGIGTRR